MVSGGRYGLMAYPLTAPITMDSKADKLTVMAVRIVICLRMETPPHLLWWRHEEGLRQRRTILCEVAHTALPAKCPKRSIRGLPESRQRKKKRPEGLYTQYQGD